MERHLMTELKDSDLCLLSALATAIVAAAAAGPALPVADVSESVVAAAAHAVVYMVAAVFEGMAAERRK